MFGLGSTLKMTPLKTGKVRFFINFNPSGIGTATSPSTYKLAYGTGTAPVNGASATGTVFDTSDSGSNYTASVSSPSYTHTHDFIISGLTVNTAYWFDVQAQKGSGSTSVGMGNIRVSIQELPY
jgi:phosphodiesterase/alkaline phosphatase D-like protein